MRCHGETEGGRHDISQVRPCGLHALPKQYVQVAVEWY